MAIDIRTPNINAPTESGRLEQIRSYLYQISEQLNWAFRTVETNISTVTQQSVQTGAKTSTPEEETLSNFNSLKALIIKSADIVAAWSDDIVKLVDQKGLYVAKSDYGTFEEATFSEVFADVKGLKENIVNRQEILDENGNIQAKLLVNGHIFSGIIEYAKSGEAIIGIEIGQTTEANGKEVFKQFARFTADRLSFYDSIGTEVAYISDEELVITTAKILGNLLFGETTGYKLDTSDGIIFKWEAPHPTKESTEEV